MIPLIPSTSVPLAASVSLSPSAPWQRADSVWPFLPDSPTGLDDKAQRILRYGLTLLLDRRQQCRRAAERAGQPVPLALRPHSLLEVGKRRFFSTALRWLTALDILRYLRQELAMMVDALETPPRPQAGQTWQDWLEQYDRWHALLAQQCQRVGLLYVDLARRLGRLEARRHLACALEDLLPAAGG